METKANHFIIGIFVLGVLAAAFGFIYWVKNLGVGQSSSHYHILFEGSVGGLSQASNVLFNGIRVGKVHNVEIYSEDTRKVRVLVAVEKNIPIRTNSRARVENQGLTGVPVVQITAGTPDAPLLTATIEGQYPIIKADRAQSQSLFEAAPEVLSNANALFVRLNDLVANNEDSIRKTVKNVESFTQALESNKEDVTEIIRNAKELSNRFNKLAVKLETSIDKFSSFMGGDGESFLDQAKEAATSFREMAKKLEESLGKGAEGVVRLAKRSLEEFELFMRDGRRAARSLDRVLERIERNPQSFLFGGSNVREYNPKQ